MIYSFTISLWLLSYLWTTRSSRWKQEASQEAIRAIHILRDVLMVWTAMEVEDRFRLEGESREQGHSLADGEEKDE